MSETGGEASESENDKNQGGVILGFWDHEKTPSLIADLEHSVNSVEQKCKKLLEELIYYKKFLKDSHSVQPNRSECKGKKNNKNSRLLCGSDPDISFRKKLLSNLHVEQAFEEKFREQLKNVNQELTEAADKIGLKDNIFLFPNKDYVKTIHSETQQHIDKTWSNICQEFLKINYLGSMTKSDSMLKEQFNKKQCSQITESELKLYQKLSRLSLKKKGRRRGKELKRVKFACVRKPAPKMEETSRKLLKERKKKRRKRRSRREQRETISQKSDIQLMCKALTETIQKTKAEKAKRKEQEQEGEGGRASLGSVVRKVLPFTTCKSTSKSYNIGVNVQQFLSQTKYDKVKNWDKKKQRSREGERGLTEWNPENAYRAHDNIWIAEHHTSANIRKVRSRCTRNAPEEYVEYHKSQTMSQYRNGQKSMIKSESKTAYTIGSKIVMSGCRRTDYYQIDQGGRYYASGDGMCKETCDKMNLDWSKVYSAFVNIYKKYIELKRNIVQNECGLSDNKIEILENEIDQAMEKYKDFLQFYSKFLQLKHRLKSLKIARDTKLLESETSFPQSFGGRTIPMKLTSSMIMKKALREIQELQEKIRLIRDY